jgi:hypothetical protein
MQRPGKARFVSESEVLETGPKYRLSRLSVYEYRCIAALWQPSRTAPEPEKTTLK